MSIITSLLTLFSIFVILATVLPLFRLGIWWIRIWDFPRVHILLIGFVCLVFHIALIRVGAQSSYDELLVIALLLSLGYQAHRIRPFTLAHSVDVPSYSALDTPEASAEKENRKALRILCANLRYDNTEYDSFLEIASGSDADILTLSEVSEAWSRALTPLKNTHPYEVSCIREDGHGLAIYSRSPLDEGKTHFLVSKERPSLSAKITLDTRSVTLWAIHPAPPAIRIETGERKSSRPRDAELMILAKELKGKDTPTIVMGDFNDTAWSQTTREFSAVSGLRDPRIGRGFYNTYHSQYPLLRYPIDHVFVSAHFAIESLERLENFGSDHFPMSAAVHLLHHSENHASESARDEEEPQEDEIEEIIDDGLEKAKEYEGKKEHA